MTKISEYWDTIGKLISEDCPRLAYLDYCDFVNRTNDEDWHVDPLTLRDFEDHIESLKGNEVKMNKELLEKIISLDIDSKGVYRIYGRIKGKRGGAFHGFTEQGEPIFGEGNLIHAPIWWNHSRKEICDICDKIIARYPNCEAVPKKCN